MLDVKNAIFKIALLPPQCSEFATANAERTVQKNQQLIPKRKLAQTKFNLLRSKDYWSLPSLCAHSNTDARTSLPSRTHLHS
jgi:hypothetical protein